MMVSGFTFIDCFHGFFADTSLVAWGAIFCGGTGILLHSHQQFESLPSVPVEWGFA